MIDGIFTRLKPETSSAIRKPIASEQNTPQPIDVDIEDLTAALSSVAGEIEMAHSNFQKLYEEASYIYSRLDYMEKSYTSQQKDQAAKQVKEEDDESGKGGSGTTSVVVNKVLFAGAHNTSLDHKLAKIQDAKQLTQNLLSAIEMLSEKVKKTNKVNVTQPEVVTSSMPSIGMK